MSVPPTFTFKTFKMHTDLLPQICKSLFNSYRKLNVTYYNILKYSSFKRIAAKLSKQTHDSNNGIWNYWKNKVSH